MAKIDSALLNPTGESAPPVETAAPASESTPTPAPTSPPAPESAPPVSAKELERIAALDAREARLREAEARAKAADEARSRAEAESAASWNKFYRNPLEHIRAMRPDLSPAEAAQVAEQLYVYSLGDKAPPEVRQRIEASHAQTEVRSEVEKLRSELEELRAERARQDQLSEIARYQAELRSGAAAVKDAPIVSGLLQRNPDRAAQMLFEVARRAAIASKERGDAEPVVLNPEQAARELEKYLVAERDALYGAPAVAGAPSTQVAPPSPTITNRDASVQPGKTVADSFDDKELRRAALKAAGLEHVAVWD